MRLWIKTFFIITLILFSAQSAIGQAVLYFEKEFDAICKSQQTILAKKVFLTVFTSVQRGYDPCDDQIIDKLISSCGSSSLTCQKLVTIYHEINNKYEGRVIGR